MLQVRRIELGNKNNKRKYNKRETNFLKAILYYGEAITDIQNDNQP